MSHRSKPNAPNGYFAFVKVAGDERSTSVMEIPKEENGSLLLSTLKGSFPSAAGLRYKSSSGGWRGVRISDNVLDAPHGGWGNNVYYITLQKSEASKRKISQSPREERGSKSAKYSEPPKLSRADQEMLKDMIVLGLPFKCGDDDLKNYFTKECGDLAYSEVKYDRDTKKARGFGFIRFKKVEGAKKALSSKHCIMGRTLEIKLSKKKENPMKVFVGRIPNGTTQEDLKKHFAEFGDVSDAYIPTPFRGFGFVTFTSCDDGRAVLRREHKIGDTRLNVVFAEPKDEKRDHPNRNDQSFSNSERRNDAGDPYKFDSRQMDSNRDLRDSTDSRGPRDFRDPVERNQMERSSRDRSRGEREMGDRNMRENLRDRGDLRETRDMGDNRGIRERDPRDRDVRERIPRESELKGRELNERDSREARLLRDTIREQRELRDERDNNRNQVDIGNLQRGNPRELPNYRGPIVSRDLGNQQRGAPMVSRDLGNQQRGAPMVSRDLGNQQRGAPMVSRDLGNQQRVDPSGIKDFRGDMISRDVAQQQRGNPGEINYRGSLVSNTQQRGDPRELPNYRGLRDSRDLNEQPRGDLREIKDSRGTRDSRELNNDQQRRNSRDINYRETMVSSDRNDQLRGDPRELPNYRGPLVSSDRNTQLRGDPREIKDYRGSLVSSSDRNIQQRDVPREITNYRGSMMSSDRNTQQRGGDPRDTTNYRGSMMSSDRNTQQRADPRDIKDHKGSTVTRDRHDQRIFLNNQSKYDSRHDLQSIKHQHTMQRAPPGQDVAAELKNMIYHFLGSSN